jgi:type I restriction enzyme S subunit
MSYKISCYDIFKLGEYTEIQPGYAFKSDQFLDDDTQVPLVKGENLQQGYVDWSASKYWRKEEYQDFEKYHLLPGDVIIAMDRPWVTAGLKWSYIKNHDPKSLLVQRVARLRGKDGLSQSFLKVLISSDYFSCYVQPIVTGVNVPHISGKQIADFKAPIPPLVVQNKIAAILSSYDDLIENNKCRIAILEKMAEEIYREWFVRFRFPGYQDAEFEKGIPKGWGVKKLNDICELLYGKALTQEEREDGPFPVYGSSGVVGYHKKALTNSGGIIVGRKGNVGSIHWCDVPFFPIDTVYYVKSDLSMHYVFYLLGSMNFINNDAAVPGLNRNQAYSNLLLMPGLDLIELFEVHVKPLFEQKKLLAEQIQNLEATKSLLLPRLISGKLSVEDLNIAFPASMQEVG